MIATKQKYKIGIDIGGTNTDSVLIDSEGVITACTKTATTPDINSGIKTALTHVLKESQVSGEDISGIFIGTTQIVNAILQCANLYKVGVIRVAGHYPTSIPSCYTWPENLKKALYVDTISVSGGYECDGSHITPTNPAEIKAAIETLLKKKVESIAVVGAFSSLNPCQELLVKEIAQKISHGSIPISLSHQIGGTGFIERENSTILNAALKQVMSNAFKGLRSTCLELGLVAPVWVTQNNGSIVDLNHAIECPILTISAGPTNSFIGGMKLSNLQDAIIIDVGGTSTDVGIVRNGIPRRCLNNTKIGGITLNFPMPDVYSIGMGGGSHIEIGSSKILIGPKSCGSNTFTESLSFGGKQLTLTDISIALGHVQMPGARPQNVILSHKGCRAVLNEAIKQIYSLIAKIGPEEAHMPIIMIGGGSSLFPKNLLDSRFVIPPYANVANAYGAALALISGVVDTVVSLEDRQEVLDRLQQQAIQMAIQKGADYKTVKIENIDIIPYHYVPNRMARVIVRATGNQPHF